jgi:hypothetical protein
MSTLFARNHLVRSGIFIAMAVALSTANAAPGNGVPFQQLQQQIDALKSTLEQLKKSPGGNSGDQNVTVTCTSSDTIGAALAKASPGGRLTITVKDTCAEDVTIERDRVTLFGGAVAGTGTQPAIQVLGARGVVIQGMTVLGGASHGILATRNADVTIVNTTVESTGDGVQLLWGAFADIRGSTITSTDGSAVSPRDGAGALLTDNPLLSTRQSDASLGAAIFALRGTTVRLGGGNTISNTGNGWAMFVIQGSTVRAQGARADSVLESITGRVDISRLSNVDIRNAAIAGNVFVGSGSLLRFSAPASIVGNVDIGSHGSIAEFLGTPTVSGPTISGRVSCLGSATVGPVLEALTLKDSQNGPVMTSRLETAWAFRGIAAGNPNFVDGGRFLGCN